MAVPLAERVCDQPKTGPSPSMWILNLRTPESALKQSKTHYDMSSECLLPDEAVK